MEMKIPENVPFKSQDFHHVGIIVKDMDKTIEHLETVGIGPFGMMGEQKWVNVTFKGELHGKPAEWSVKISSTKVGNTELELLQPSGGESVLQEFLDEKGEGVHHIAFAFEDVSAALEHAGDKGIRLIDSKPRKGAEGLQIGFLHPASTFGVLTEFCGEK